MRILFTLTTLALISSAAAQTPTSYVKNDAAHKTVTIIVNAGEGNDNGGLNFNGSDHAKTQFTVPAGWTVQMQFKNVGMMPHSAIVTAGKTPPSTITAKDAAFAKAYTTHLTDGLPGGSSAQKVTFKASKAGTYNIVCGVPGHGLGGQYIGFVVSSSAKTATYK
ncbi:sulfocyanin-like copper-binding protein [Deinococcus sonorensis]|uniref:Sulfocyanin-like copper-binding protein n=2 Tax=Deinococcus sonorensis TaxID=309891 RepID=A0AAU7U815_9DEIO